MNDHQLLEDLGKYVQGLLIHFKKIFKNLKKFLKRKPYLKNQNWASYFT